MKIAVTYDNGDVFQHFGRTEAFKVYEVENDQVTDSYVMGAGGAGHEALAEVLAVSGIDVLICGGIGPGAQNALAACGIQICAGAEGNTDEAVEAYLRGELQDAGVTCHHHDGEEHHCGHHDDGEGGCCGHHGEGGCCGRHRQIQEIGPNAGKTVRVHYRGTFNDGSQFDSSYDRNEPLEFVCGAGMMIPGFDKAVANMTIGQIVDVHLMPEEAYGMADPSLIISFAIADTPGSEGLKVGDQVYLSNAYGQPIPVIVTAKDDTTITVDANHEMAGKELNFRIELVEIQ